MATMSFEDFLAAKSRSGNTAFVAALSPEDAKVFLADLAENCFWHRYHADIADEEGGGSPGDDWEDPAIWDRPPTHVAAITPLPALTYQDILRASTKAQRAVVAEKFSVIEDTEAYARGLATHLTDTRPTVTKALAKNLGHFLASMPLSSLSMFFKASYHHSYSEERSKYLRRLQEPLFQDRNGANAVRALKRCFGRVGVGHAGELCADDIRAYLIQMSPCISNIPTPRTDDAAEWAAYWKRVDASVEKLQQAMSAVFQQQVTLWTDPNNAYGKAEKALR